MKTNFDFRLSGFLIALVVVSMLATGFGVFMTGIQDTYQITGENSLAKYNYTNKIIDSSKDIKDEVQINQTLGVLDIVGAYFSSGWSALKVSFYSVAIYEGMAEDMAGDLEFMQRYALKDYLIAIIVFGIFVGVGITILVKMRT